MGGAITGTGERELPDFPECIVIPLLSVLRRYDLTQALSHKDHQAPFSTSVTAHERERKREKETERKRKRATESGRGRKREEKHPANERKKGEREGASEREAWYGMWAKWSVHRGENKRHGPFARTCTPAQ